MSMFLRDTPGRTAIHNEDFFSVAIVSFNRFHRLKHLIETIHKHADMPFEIVVSDDGGALYDDFNFIRDIKDKVSHVAVNLGRNKGLHVNANSAIGLTRSKYVLCINDDLEILKPFMRQSIDILKHAPYISSIFLEQFHNTDSPKEHLDNAGYLEFCTKNGTKFACHMYMGSMAPVFRKDYWYEVGGYAEDDIYGDLPFNTKGYLRGYMAAVMEGGPFVFDTDKGGPDGGSEDSSGKYIDVGYANYPKIFGWSPSEQLSRDRQRSQECGQRNSNGRASGDFNEYGIEGWVSYGKAAVQGGNIDWNLLESKYHKRFIKEMKRDLVDRYGNK